MRLTPLARRLGAAALVLALGAGLSSCSDDRSATGASRSSSEEPTEASAEEPADSVSAEETGAASGTSLAELSADDFYPSVMTAMREAETFTFETVSEAAGQSQTMTGQARLSDDGIEMKASSAGLRAMELIVLDTAMYMRSPDLGAGDTWVEIDLGDPDSLFGMIGRATDPEAVLKAMESPQQLELVGAEDLDGTPTNHYRITLDPASHAAAMGFPAAMADMLPEELVTEMWVDADNLPRAFAQTIDVPSGTGGAPTSTTTEGTYSDFGADVQVEAPPADQVTGSFPGA